LWMHCASLGEFEQGRPLLEAFRRRHPEWQILLTFFSPSGYDLRKDFPGADFVEYLPEDLPALARQFVEILRPTLAVFVRYEFWYHHLQALREAGVRVVLVSGVFRQGQPFFRWYGRLHRRMLGCFDRIFVQDHPSEQLLRSIGYERVVRAGDTRIDRVAELPRRPFAHPLLEAFCEGRRVVVCGSTHPRDEALLAPIIRRKSQEGWRFLLAPHEIDESELRQTATRLGVPLRRLSEGTAEGASVLLVDNVGMLGKLYRFARLAYVGGGFDAGIHNLLEPAAYGVPVVFGPRHGKFPEARALLDNGGGFSVRSSEQLDEVFRRLEDAPTHRRAAEACRAFIEANRGATGRVLDELETLLPPTRR
ncbi:MAG: 3-deoxy-D-manno-octulosonic acid transferase, partial [Bacteroidetes bacterium]